MDERERPAVILRTYSRVWKWPKKVYSIDTIKLLVPVEINEALYFVVSVGIAMLLVKVIPFIGKLPFMIKYGAIPFGLMKFLTKQKLDGKLPHKFFFDYLVYRFSPRKFSHFKPVENYGRVKFATPIVFRDMKIVNKTAEALKKANKKSYFEKKDKSKKKERKQKVKAKKGKFKPGMKIRKGA